MSARPVSEPIRVAQLVTTMARGGAQATVVASSDGAEPGIEVTVLSGPEITDEGTYWNSDALDRVPTVLVPNLVRRLSPTNDIRTLWWLVRWFRTNRPDVVHTHSSKAGVLGRLAAKAAGIPCVHTVHGWGPLCSASPVIRLVSRLIERSLAHLCDVLVVVGQPDLTFGFVNRIGRPDQYRVIRSGIDTSVARAAADDRRQVRAELGVGDRFVVGMVARMSSQKDHRTLVKAFADADLPESILLLVGDGPLRTEILRLTADLGIEDRVVFLGVRPDAARLVAGFDVSVLSSRWEGMPRTVVEAAAAGVPVVATDVGSVAELIEDGISGTLVSVGDVFGLATALSGVHRSQGEALAMATVAADRSSQFSAVQMRRQLAELWRSIADSGLPGSNERAPRRPLDSALTSSTSSPSRDRTDDAAGRPVGR